MVNRTYVDTLATAASQGRGRISEPDVPIIQRDGKIIRIEMIFKE